MALLILFTNRDPQPWEHALHSIDPKIDIRIWPETGDPADVDFVLAWNHPAGELRKLGFPVCGWSRTPKKLTGIRCFSGRGQFPLFLAHTDILICLLPLTPATKNILNRENFSRLKRGAFLINVARGKHLAEEDLLEALDSGQLSGACLDVFRQEPLPADHPFWRHPKITITPHISSITDPQAAARQIVENDRRLQEGKALRNVLYEILPCIVGKFFRAFFKFQTFCFAFNCDIFYHPLKFHIHGLQNLPPS